MVRPPTLKELAKLLNLAPSTVSRALKSHSDISKETQEKVKALALALHYKPNAVALSLRNRKSDLIAIIVPDLTNYFYAEVVKGVIGCAYANKYKVVVFENDEKYEREVEICGFLERSGLDGLLIVPVENTSDISHFKALQAGGIPLVFVDRVIGELDSDRVVVDDFNGAYAAVSHMIESGCQKIAHLAAPLNLLWAQKRQMGYVQALLDHHLPVNRKLMVICSDSEDGVDIVSKMLKSRMIDGVFTMDDESAAKLLRQFELMGWSVPSDIAVCGFGNNPITEVTCPSLTTVDRNGEYVGQVAMGLLLGRVNGKLTESTETKLLKTLLVVRDSTSFLKRPDINRKI